MDFPISKTSTTIFASKLDRLYLHKKSPSIPPSLSSAHRSYSTANKENTTFLFISTTETALACGRNLGGKEAQEGRTRVGVMFDSLSLSRNGPLGAIWVAAYCHKRLKKVQVTQTDIPSSVGWCFGSALAGFRPFSSLFEWKFRPFFSVWPFWAPLFFTGFCAFDTPPLILWNDVLLTGVMSCLIRFLC